MPSNQSEITMSAVLQSMEIAYVVPQIIAYRVNRMMLAGPMPSTRDRKEFQLMGAEKLAAVAESWSAMACAANMAIQPLAVKLIVSMITPWMLDVPGPPSRVEQFSTVMPGIISTGIAPIHRRVMANAERLGCTTWC